MNNLILVTKQNELLIEIFLDTIASEQRVSENTLSAYKTDIKKFCEFTYSTLPVIKSLLEINQNDIEEFLVFRIENQFKPRSTARSLSALKRIYQYFLREQQIEINPVINIVKPKTSPNLPKPISETDINRLLSSQDLDDPIGLRDKAMLELLYATGLQVSELVSLRLIQINLKHAVVEIKGNKARFIPMGKEASRWLERFIKQGRLRLIKHATDFVFPSKRGTGMTRQTFWHRIKYYALRAGITADLSPNTLRHAFATHLINHGTDLKVVQLMMGHSDLSTTQIYAHIEKERMKIITQAYQNSEQAVP